MSSSVKNEQVEMQEISFIYIYLSIKINIIYEQDVIYA